jgi:hypothetical protein
MMVSTFYGFRCSLPVLYSILIYPSSAPHSTTSELFIWPQAIHPPKPQHAPPFRRCSAPLPTDESELQYVSPAPAFASTHRLLLLLLLLFLLSVPRGHRPAHLINQQSQSAGSLAPTSRSVSFLLPQARIGPAPSFRGHHPVHLIDKESQKSTLRQCWQLPKFVIGSSRNTLPATALPQHLASHNSSLYCSTEPWCFQTSVHMKRYHLKKNIQC